MSSLILPAPLWRRLAAALYDGLLLIALWMIAVMAATIVQAVIAQPIPRATMQALLFATGGFYFGYSWRRGHTLGMSAWQLRVRRADGAALTWTQALVRYALAWVSWGAAGIGVLWSLVDPQRRAWHDILTGTEVVVLPKAPPA